VTWSAALALSLASACGGNSFSSSDEPKGGEASAGTLSAGGTGQVGGKGSGGKHTAGTTSTAGSAAGGRSGGEACNAYPDSGNCEAYMERWYHDPGTGLCRGFIYGGCGGNDNNYETFEQCQKACPGGSPNYDACTQPTDCTIAGSGCCGICDSPVILARDLIAYNKQYAPDLFLCTGPGAAAGAAPPADIACVPCPALTGDSGSLKYFVPNCVQGACVVEDIRESALSLCKTEQDCMLRNGNGCCEGCGGSQVIAINKSGAFNELVCSDSSTCLDCEPTLPPGAIARCNPATNHCEVAYALGAK
jgi:hypothetical protein